MAIPLRADQDSPLEVGQKWKRIISIVCLTGAVTLLLSASKQPSMMLTTGTFATLLTELIPNLETVRMILPVLSRVSGELAIDPYLLSLAATVAASCAFMLPVSTAPNAIVYGSGKITISDMIKAGIWLNLAGMVLIVVFVSLLSS